MNEEEHIVISLGGSLIVPEAIDTEFLSLFIKTIKDCVALGHKFVIITGGGKIARHYQNALKDFKDIDKNDLDWLGIYTTRLNAELLLLAFGDLAHKEIVIDPTNVPKTSKPVILGAGWKPGFSTDYVAVLIAEQTGSHKIANLSNIDFAYDKDPKHFPEAKIIKESSWAGFRAILPKEWDPGLSSPFDPIAAEKAERLGLEVVIMNGKNIENFKKYLDNKEFIGTIIK